jgi:hydrogenase expression/formation protein HypE
LANPGKEAPEFMERVVYSNLGFHSRRVKVGPGIGLDNGVISLGNGRVMLVTVDPVSAIPAFGMKLSAWLSVHLIASDLTSSGVDPELAIFSYNFPPTMTAKERSEYLRAMGSECKRLGIAIVAGHTGSYPGGGYTVIGSGTMLGFAPEGGYLTPSMSQVGDAILMTKHAAIEATGSLALFFPHFVEQKVGSALAKRAKSMIRLCSTVEDARAVGEVGLGKGGVTSMHDATEGGVLGALDEMAVASGKMLVVDGRKIPVSPEAEGVCSAFGLDPLTTMGEGALLITCGPGKVRGAKLALARAGIESSQIGVVRKGSGLVSADGAGRLRRYRAGRDRYWTAYDAATRKGLS